MPRYVRTQSIEHPIGPTGRLSLQVTSADVRVRGTDAERAALRATFEISAGSDAEADAIFERGRLIVTATDDELSVAEPDGEPGLGGALGRFLSGRNSVEYDVEVEVPRRAGVQLETVSGEITAEALHGDQRLVTVSGDMFLNDSGGSARINSVSGDIVVRARRPLATRVEAVSGDLSLSAPRIENLRAHAVSGDVEIEGELAPSGEFRVETVSGDLGVGLVGSATFEVRGLSTDISSDLDHRVEGRLDRRRLVIGSGEPTVIFSSMSGDLSVRRPRRLPAAVAADEPAGDPAARAHVLGDAEQMAVLQALERGEIDVDEATRRLAGGSPDA